MIRTASLCLQDCFFAFICEQPS